MPRSTPAPPGSRPARRGERGYRRALFWGLAASAAIHAAALLLSPTASVPGDGGPRGQAGPEPRPPGLRAVDARLSERPRRVESRPEIAVAVPSPSRPAAALAQMDPVPVDRPTPSWGSAADGGGDQAGVPAAATGSGGGGSGGYTPPVPRSLLPDWSPPPEVRGHRVTVRVEVDARGRPTGRVELAPPTPSEDFNRRLRERMVRLEFLPARRDGRPVSAWAEITFTF